RVRSVEEEKSCSWRAPSAFFAFVLFTQPFQQRPEILGNRRRVDLARPGQFLQRLLPRLALAQRQHLTEALAGLGIAVDRAFAQRTGVTRSFAQRAMKLELQDVGEEVARVRRVRRNVVLRARVEIFFAARHRSADALVLLAQLPPCSVVVLRLDLAREYL